MNWLNAIQDELNSMIENEVWEIVDRQKYSKDGSKPTIIKSRWVSKKKFDFFKARLVIKGDQDQKKYELREIYSPVTRLPLVRTVLAIINKNSNGC